MIFLKDAILKILDEFPEWKALSIGDEETKIYLYNHKQS